MLSPVWRFGGVQFFAFIVRDLAVMQSIDVIRRGATALGLLCNKTRTYRKVNCVGDFVLVRRPDLRFCLIYAPIYFFQMPPSLILAVL
jgi:hypothetical protein